MPPKTGPTAPRLCAKCRTQEATLDSRSQPVCRDCFTKFLSSKCVKQIGILGKEVPPPPATTGGNPHHVGTRHYLVGLSLGVSSTVLLHLLNENIEYQLAKGRSPPFELTVFHVSSPLSPLAGSGGSDEREKIEQTLDAYREKFPRFSFRNVPVSSAMRLRTVDWGVLGLPLPEGEGAEGSDEERLQQFLSSLPPTMASVTDILRVLTSHVLLAAAAEGKYQALLLGHSTTALAELTLAETAKGKGFSLPWRVNDGVVPVVEYGDSSGDGAGEKGSVVVYHPLRDALRKELVTFAGLTEPPLTALILEGAVMSASGSGNGQGAVVSHKDLSIEEVISRYFAEVEEGYPSIVANVARTTSKLVRNEPEEGGRCRLCGMPLDGDGDERWRGELRQEKAVGDKGRMCYGCVRSVGG